MGNNELPKVEVVVKKGKLFKPLDWKVRCRKDSSWCESFMQEMHRKGGFRVLYGDKPPKGLSKKEIIAINKICQKKFTKLDEIQKCATRKSMVKEFQNHEGGHRGNKRSANEAIASSGATLWIGLGALGLVLLLVAITAYWFLFGGKKEKDESTKGTGKASKSKLGGKSKISSRKSGKKSRKGSLRSKSGGKSRRSKGSLKK